MAGLTGAEALPYRAPKPGRDYWILDRALPRPDAVLARLAERKDWVYGAPYRIESWPGMRVKGGLSLEELAPIERWVRAQTKARSLYQAEAHEHAQLDHNVVQRVGAGEGGPRPHTDSRRLCTYAAVLYLSPRPTADSGTTFYRLRLAGGRLGGNTVEAPYANLVEALGARTMSMAALAPDVTVENVYNRLLVYRGNLIHSATGYFGGVPEERRTTAVFFWMARM